MTNLGGRRYTESELRSAGFKSVGKNVQISNRASIYGVENISIGDNVRIDDFATLIATNSLEIGSYVRYTQLLLSCCPFWHLPDGLHDFSAL